MFHLWEWISGKEKEKDKRGSIKYLNHEYKKKQKTNGHGESTIEFNHFFCVLVFLNV